jgi:hypothetical protein
MYLVLCFLYCFFAIVLGTYLGFELISVRKAERIARTILKSAAPPPPAAETLPDAAAEPTPNYFSAK